VASVGTTAPSDVLCALQANTVCNSTGRREPKAAAGAKLLLNVYFHYKRKDRLCGLVVSVTGYKSRGLGFDCGGCLETSTDSEVSGSIVEALWRSLRLNNRLCRLLVRVPGYRSRGLGLDTLGY
jgi:hypothetical protein